MSKHLERTYGDLHEMSLRLEQVVQQKKTIEERLETTFYDLERKTEKVEELEKQVLIVDKQKWVLLGILQDGTYGNRDHAVDDFVGKF